MKLRFQLLAYISYTKHTWSPNIDTSAVVRTGRLSVGLGGGSHYHDTYLICLEVLQRYHSDYSYHCEL